MVLSFHEHRCEVTETRPLPGPQPSGEPGDGTAPSPEGYAGCVAVPSGISMLKNFASKAVQRDVGDLHSGDVVEGRLMVTPWLG